VLDKGQIVAQGTHDELMERSPIYAEIYSSQLVDDAPSASPSVGPNAGQNARAVEVGAVR